MSNVGYCLMSVSVESGAAAPATSARVRMSQLQPVWRYLMPNVRENQVLAHTQHHADYPRTRDTMHVTCLITSCSVTYAWLHGQNPCFHTTGRIVMPEG